MTTPNPTNILESLGPDSYTAHRLLHATPEHLYLTTRRCFIGPIPEGWLKSHRREWYKHHLRIHNRSASFAAGSNVDHSRRSVTGLDDPHKRSFPQPVDLADEEDEDDDGEQVGGQAAVTTSDPPAVPVPRAEAQAVEVLKGDDSQAVPHEHVLQTEEEDRGHQAVHDQGDTLKIKKKDNETTEASRRKPDSENVTTARPEPSSLRSSFKSGMAKAKSDRRASFKSAMTKPKSQRTASMLSFVTAKETLPSISLTPEPVESQEQPQMSSQTDGQLDVPSTDFPRASTVTAGSATSSTPLLPPEPVEEAVDEPEHAQPQGILGRLKAKVPKPQVDGEEDQDAGRAGRGRFVSFITPDDQERHVKSRMAQISARRPSIRRTQDIREGEAVKFEKMLVRVELTKHDIPDEFDENDGRKIETQVLDKWKEFMVVCREAHGDDTEYSIHMYKTRVIQAVEKEHVKKKAAYDIPLDRKAIKVSLYSSLDKTIVLCQPVKAGTRLYIMRPRCAANSMEWFTFFRNVLGRKRASVLQVNVPDLSVHLKLDNPFAKVESTHHLFKAAADGDADALEHTLKEEEAAADTVVARCMQMLEKSKEWHDIVSKWAGPPQSELQKKRGDEAWTEAYQDQTLTQSQTGHHPVGLAWRRYDRIEWVHGTNEKRMYGTIGMERTHELELRPKTHYPSTAKNKKGETLVEPAAVEGFLVRLSSQKGDEQRIGKLFFKKLYFSTHSNFLVFNRPAQADPPPPPKLPMRTDSKVPSSHQIAEAIPLIYAVNPFPLQDGQITWLTSSHPSAHEHAIHHDQDAADEHDRRTSLLLKSDGVINLSNVIKVRPLVRGATPADASLDSGSEVDFDESVSNEASHRDDGTITDMDDARTFELVLANGLILRLQAFDRTTKLEWMRRLSALAVYWRHRTSADAALLAQVRQRNLDLLDIDEDREALVGQYARKWEITQSYASPELYNMCPLSACRSITLSGFLFRKARMHANFVRSLVVLASGHLLIYRESVRGLDGSRKPHIHHERLTSLDLSDCYVYSGLVTEDDLLYTARTPDAGTLAMLQGSGLPRRWREDAWSSTDEDVMTTFVVWHGRKSSWFKSVSEGGQPAQSSKSKNARKNDATTSSASSAQGQLQNQNQSRKGDQQQQKGTRVGRRARLRKVSALGVEGRSAVFKCRSRAERDQWVMALNVEIERVSASASVEGTEVRVEGG